MEILVEAGALKRAVQTASRAISGKSTLRILGHLHVSVDAPAGRLTLAATNLEIWSERTLPAKISLALGEDKPSEPTAGDENDTLDFTVPAREFLALFGAFSETDDVILSRNKGDKTVRILCGRLKATMAGLPAWEFPHAIQLETKKIGGGANTKNALLGEATFSASALADALGMTAFAASHEETRPELCSVVFEAGDKSGDGNISLLATNTHRGVICDLRAQNLSTAFGFECLVPISAIPNVVAIAKFAGEGTIAVRFAENAVSFAATVSKASAGKNKSAAENGEAGEAAGAEDGGAWRLTTRLLAGTYPGLRRLFSDDHDKTVTFKTSEALSAFRRTTLYAKDSANRVLFDAEGQHVALSASSVSLGETREEVECAPTGGPILIAFNALYLVDVLSRIKSEGVHFSLTKPLRPALLTRVGDSVASDDVVGYRYLCMPMQVPE